MWKFSATHALAFGQSVLLDRETLLRVELLGGAVSMDPVIFARGSYEHRVLMD